MHRTILLVEDDVEIRQSLVDVLEDEGYQIFQASNGREGMDLLMTLNENPCLIILDLMMPVLDGPSFYLELKNNQKISAIPTICFSADGQLLKKARQIGISEILKKPVELNDLFGVVKKYCSLG